MIAIRPDEIPDEGLHLTGSLQKDIFELGPEDEIRPAGPTEYDLEITAGEDVVLAQGRVETPFTLRCVVCLEDFRYTCRIAPYFADLEPGDDGVIDLGDRLREDLLLKLPTYPHCDEGDDPDRVCPMAERLEQLAPDPDAAKPSAWDALDGLEKGGKTGD